MSTLIDTPKSARHEHGFIEIEMNSGHEIRFPVTASPRLRTATPEQLAQIELSPFGLHWPQVDEDLSIRGILADRYGTSES